MNRELILITGVSGRIGFRTAELFSKEYLVVGIDQFPLPHPINGVEFVQADIASKESFAKAFAEIKKQYGTKIASVIHLAAYYNFAGGGWDKYETITVQGTKRLLEELASFTVDQFIFSSTMLIHAPCEPDQAINEEWPIEPKWDYPLSKVKTEEIIHELHGSMSSVILRIAGVYDDYCHSIPISNQIERIYDKDLESHFYPGHLTHGSSFVHMDDLVNALRLAVQKRAQLPKESVFMIGEPETLSYGELQNIIGTLIWNKPWATYRIPKLIAKIGAFVKRSFIKPWMIDLADDNYTLDITRARTILGWKPSHTLRDTLPRMIAALKQDPAGWFKSHGIKR